MKLQQPIWPRLVPDKVLFGLATLGPVGRRLPAPGTWGSVAGLLYFTVFLYPLTPLGMVLLSLAGGYFAVGFCGEAAFRMRRRDPGEVILDEFVAMPLCLVGWRAIAADGWPNWAIFLAAFAVFRVYDIVKPFGIRRLQDLPAGWGIVVDDFAAAIAGCLTLHLAAWAWRVF